MRTHLLLAFATIAGTAAAQEVDRAIREGNSAYKKGDQSGAIRAYEKARADQRGTFNLGNAYYRQDSVADAQRTFEAASTLAKDPAAQARAFHNLGNSWMKQQKWQEAANAYKQALKRKPDDDDTRYNLAYAQKKLQEEQKKKDKNKDQKQDQQQQQPQDQQQQQDQKQDPKDQKDQEPQQNKDQQSKDQQQQKPGQMGQQDAQRMLDAMQQQEKDSQKKARDKMRVRAKLPIEKDW